VGRFIRRIALLAILAGIAVAVGKKLGLIGGEDIDDEDYSWDSPSDADDQDTGNE
jgi:hypothetical protein